MWTSPRFGDIDWKKVARSGIDFAIIRLGYRGYGSGKLVEDEYAQKNLAGATEAGLPIGAYFFSQALSMDEADQEIEYMLGILGTTGWTCPSFWTGKFPPVTPGRPTWTREP